MREFIDLKERINRLLDEALNRSEGDGLSLGHSGEWSPRIDLYELPDRIVMRADLPGLAPADLDVRVEGGQLVLTGQRQQPQDLDNSHLRRLERPFGSFCRRYALPDGIDPESVRASYGNGVLEIVLRKGGETAVRRVPIQS